MLGGRGLCRINELLGVMFGWVMYFWYLRFFKILIVEKVGLKCFNGICSWFCFSDVGYLDLWYYNDFIDVELVLCD